MNLHLSAFDFIELQKIQRNVVGTSGCVKVTCVLMFAQSLSVQIILNSLGIDASTTSRYLNAYGGS